MKNNNIVEVVRQPIVAPQQDLVLQTEESVFPFL